MAVTWLKQSLKKRSEKELEQQTAKEEIAELQDALIELAQIVCEIADNTEVGEENG